LKCPHPGCNAVLKNKGNYRNHIRLHDPNDPNIFTCEVCGKISKK
jgi:Zinc finger, C2H2 type